MAKVDITASATAERIMQSTNAKIWIWLRIRMARKAEMKNKNTVLYLLSGVVSLVFLVYVLINLDWTILLSAFSNLQWGWLMLALLAYLINIFLRAIRFANLIYTKKIAWQEFIPVSALHNILMYLLPAKTGDVTYIFLAKNRLDISLPEGTATLFASRFYDFSVVALILAILLPFSKENMPDWIYQSAILFCLITLFCA